MKRNGTTGGRDLPRRRWCAAMLAVMLLVVGPDLATAQLAGPNPIYDLARAGDVGGIEYLLNKGYNINSPASDGETVLIAGATGGHVAVVELALAQGARIDEQDDYGRSALSRGAEGGHFAVVERLLEKKADINIQTSDGLTPLMLAVKGRHISVVQLLLRYRPDLTVRDYTGRSALGWSWELRDRRIETMLRRAGARD